MNGSILTNSLYLASVLLLAEKTCDSQAAAKTLPLELEAWGPGFGQMCSAYMSCLESMICRSLWNKVWNWASGSPKAGGSLLFWNSQTLILWASVLWKYPHRSMSMPYWSILHPSSMYQLVS